MSEQTSKSTTTAVVVFTEERELAIIADFDIRIPKIKDRNRLDSEDKLAIGRECVEAKAKLKADGRSFGSWRDKHLKDFTAAEISMWMKAAEAFDNPDIQKTGEESLNQLAMLSKKKDEKRARESKQMALEAERRKAAEALEAERKKADERVETARKEATASAIEVARTMAASTPRNCTCPKCGAEFVS